MKVNELKIPRDEQHSDRIPDNVSEWRAGLNFIY